ncbi:hypothetical protein EDD11_008044 [Mortierella claussenii]|nr:hypothetical protein EDD11_008044 [Mortierella claussenii]
MSSDANVPRNPGFWSNVKNSVIRVRGAENVGMFVEKFHSFGHVEIDAARLYGGGDTKIVLSQLPTAHLKFSTKVFTGLADAFNAVNLPKQFRQSLDALRVDKADILYLHAPNRDTPIEYGLSNDPYWTVALVHEHCKQNGYVLPTVYQGMYNPIARSFDKELLPCLNYFNIGFYAYNIIGRGGLLTGRYKFESRERAIGTKRNFEGIEILKKATEAHGVSLLEATFRWMRHHSGLEPKDGIILGASSVIHLEENLTDLEKGPLSEAVLEAFDQAWERVKPTSAYYVRVVNEPRFAIKHNIQDG